MHKEVNGSRRLGYAAHDALAKVSNRTSPLLTSTTYFPR
jgi:hypothetical protein